MTQVPARLVYTDNNSNQQIIGTFLPSDPANGNISTFTIEEDAKNYTRVIIEGAPELYDKLPSTVSEFESDEPEIFAEVDENRDGNWTRRARVYPEKGGVTNDRGRYKNEDLWGFKKYYGEDDVEVTSGTNGPITTNLKDAVDALLPNGYTASYPNDITPPNVSNFTFRGSRQKAFNEILKQYKHYIFFTTATDGGDYVVRVQPKGYGGVVANFTRGQDAYTYNNWEKNDTSNIISKVKVVGKDSNGDKIERIIAGGGSDSGGLHANDDQQPDVFIGEYSIISVDTVNDSFTISGDQLEKFTDPNSIRVVGSTGNDGVYTIDDATLDGSNDTEIFVEEDVTDSTSDGTLVNTPTRRKFRSIHIDQTITETEADNIGENIIDPKATEHGEIEAGLNIESTLNDSIGILDNRRTPSNPIDDVFTVVKQKDYIHQGTTLYSFEFESEASQEQVDKWREHDNERAKVYPEQSNDQNVGPIDIDDTATNTETVQDQYDADSQNNHGHDNNNVTSNANQLRTVFNNSKSRTTVFTGGTVNNILGATMPAKTVTGGIDFTYVSADFFFSNLSASGDITIEIVNDETGTTIETETFSVNSSGNYHMETDQDISIAASAGDLIRLDVTENVPSADIEPNLTLTSQQNHDHFVTIEPTQGEVADLTINVNTNDGSAGNTSNLTVSGQTVQELISVLSTLEDKTDR